MIKHLGIVGAGTMGAGIAQAAALAGIDVVLYDVNETVLRQALERLKRDLHSIVETGALTEEKCADALARVRVHTRLSDLSHSEIVVEAAIDDLRTKKDLFKHLEASTKPTTILASTTSFLSITAIASATTHPEKVVGLHFLYPAERCGLVELIRTERTHPEVLKRTCDFSHQIGKTAVIVYDLPGFVFNRVSQSLYGESFRILGEHIASHEQIDRIMKIEGGFASGPFESLDQEGLDNHLTVARSLSESSSGDPRFRPSPILQRMVESGRLGRKSGHGFYNYNEAKQKP